jgi:hypothetical protein
MRNIPIVSSKGLLLVLEDLSFSQVFLASPADLCCFIEHKRNPRMFPFPLSDQLKEFIDGFMDRLVLEFMEQSIVRFITGVILPLIPRVLKTRVQDLESIIDTLTTECLDMFASLVGRVAPTRARFLGKVRAGLDSLWTCCLTSYGYDYPNARFHD